MRVELQVATPVGGSESLVIEAMSEPVAVRLAVVQGYRVIAVASAHRVAVKEKRGSQFSLLLFSQELLALLEAGLSLIEALQTLHNKEVRPSAQTLIGSLLADLREGKSFSDVLSARSEHFPELYVSTVRAAERSGNLPDALSRYVVYQLQFDAIRKKLISASIYPVMLLVVGLTVMLFLLGFVVPKFASVYASSGRQVPWLSGVLLAFGNVLYHHWQWSLGAVLALGGGSVLLVSDAGMRAKGIEFILRVPALARRAAEFRLARFYRTLALLLEAGIPLARGLSMASGLFPPSQAASLARAKRAVEEGLPFSQALEGEGMATAIGSSLIRVGEKSGRLAEMLERAARFHDEDFARWVDWASRLLEPILMVTMGLIIGTVVVLLYMPIFDLAESLQ